QFGVYRTFFFHETFGRKIFCSQKRFRTPNGIRPCLTTILRLENNLHGAYLLTQEQFRNSLEAVAKWRFVRARKTSAGSVKCRKCRKVSGSTDFHLAEAADVC